MSRMSQEKFDAAQAKAGVKPLESPNKYTDPYKQGERGLDLKKYPDDLKIAQRRAGRKLKEGMWETKNRAAKDTRVYGEVMGRSAKPKPGKEEYASYVGVAKNNKAGNWYVTYNGKVPGDSRGYESKEKAMEAAHKRMKDHDSYLPDF